MDFNTVFEQIERYHKRLGYDYTNKTDIEKIIGIQQASLALYQEVGELVDSFPWKPWRNINDQTFDLTNAMQEIIDCIFFLGLIREAAGISVHALEVVFVEKMKENYDRIKRGYNNDPSERG